MPSRRLRRIAALLLAATGLLILADRTSARAQDAVCVVRFNGVEAEQVASLASPLLLGADDTLTFSGTDDAGATRAEVALLLGPLQLERSAALPTGTSGEFTVDLPLAGVAEDAVGLLRIRGTTDHCTAEAWLRVTGRSPFTTTAGLMSIGLLIAGLAGLAAALVARRGWSPWVAGPAGLLAGAGGALLAQQAGRLQLSYWSLAACSLPAAAAGLGFALVLLRRRGPRPAETVMPVEPVAAPAQTRGATGPAPAPAARSAPVADLPAVKRDAAPYWCYVLADVQVLHLDDYSQVVATLQPGSWYLVEREVSGWAQVEAAPGVEGWVPRRLVHRPA